MWEWCSAIAENTIVSFPAGLNWKTELSLLVLKVSWRGRAFPLSDRVQRFATLDCRTVARRRPSRDELRPKELLASFVILLASRPGDATSQIWLESEAPYLKAQRSKPRPSGRQARESTSHPVVPRRSCLPPSTATTTSCAWIPLAGVCTAA